MPTTPLKPRDLAETCRRAFPDRRRQIIVGMRQLPSRQHEMIRFELGWLTEAGEPHSQLLLARHYVSPLSWWRPDDWGKAQREATICEWLREEGFPVPAVYAREVGPTGDLVVFEWLEGRGLRLDGRTLGAAVEPYVAAFAALLADLHALTPPDAVRQVVPQVSLPGTLANLVALAYQMKHEALHDAAERALERAYDVPELPPVMLHGDYHFLNALLKGGQIAGLVDWEYGAWGDPRWDVANTYIQLVDFGAAGAADHFLSTYLARSGRHFEGPPLYNVVTPLQQWAISEWLVRQGEAGSLPAFALAQDLVATRDVHRRRAEMALESFGL
jgi:hypothetical protein